MSSKVIQVHNLSKRFYIGKQRVVARGMQGILDNLKLPFQRIRSIFTKQMPVYADEIYWAIKDIDFDVEQGEILGIVGHNGAGKSTLLKILAGITEPSEGEAHLYGRIGALLEVGTGFHQELTGRENVYLNGAILGMSRDEIDNKFDEIIAFAGVEEFIDTPVKRYSSGMKVRLGFAVAAHLEPEILLIDEVLAVGDAAFQEKSLGKINDVVNGGRTVIFISHNMAAVNALCTRAIWLDHGKIMAMGETSKIVQQYLEHILQADPSIQQLGYFSLQHRSDRKGDGIVRLTHLRLLDETNEPLACTQTGQTLRIALGYEVPNGTLPDSIKADLTIVNRNQQIITAINNNISGDNVSDIVRFGGELICEIPRLPLMPGKYILNAAISANSIVTDGIKNAAELQVIEGEFYSTRLLPAQGYGDVLFDYHWYNHNEPA